MASTQGESLSPEPGIPEEILHRFIGVASIADSAAELVEADSRLIK